MRCLSDWKSGPKRGWRIFSVVSASWKQGSWMGKAGKLSKSVVASYSVLAPQRWEKTRLFVSLFWGLIVCAWLDAKNLHEVP